MYSNATLYYLNQMGITPWIKRDFSTSEKLIAFIPAHLDTKAKSLLQQMLNYISEQEPVLIHLQESDSLSDYQSKVKQKNPQAVLVFGLNQKYFIENLNLNCPIFNCADPEHLLAHPIEKKQVFNELNGIKALLA